MKYLVLILALLSLSSCSVKKAGALTAPPVTEDKVFNLALMSGEFCHSDLPKVFLWPTDEKGRELSYEEMALSRQKINQYNDELSSFNEQKDSAKQQIDALFLPGIQASKTEFKAQKCYSYCNPDGWCFPDDDTVAEVDDWATPEQMVQDLPADTPPEEVEKIKAEFAAKISQCQVNQNTRKENQNLCLNEYAEKFDPLREKAGHAALSLLQEVDIGAKENYFTDFSEMNYKYENGTLFISMKYGDLLFSTDATEDLLKITEAKIDTTDGYLSFNINAINTEEDNRIYGQFKFDLEFIFIESGFRFDGDFKLANFDSGTEKVGRVSSPMSRSACTEKKTVVGRCE